MKKLLIGLLIVFGLMSCKKNNGVTVNHKPTIEELNGTQWKLTLIEDDTSTIIIPCTRFGILWYDSTNIKFSPQCDNFNSYICYYPTYSGDTLMLIDNIANSNTPFKMNMKFWYEGNELKNKVINLDTRYSIGVVLTKWL